MAKRAADLILNMALHPFSAVSAQAQPERLDFAIMRKLPPKHRQNAIILPELPGLNAVRCYRLPKWGDRWK
jgi:hypothetical protein